MNVYIKLYSRLKFYSRLFLSSSPWPGLDESTSTIHNCRLNFKSNLCTDAVPVDFERGFEYPAHHVAINKLSPAGKTEGGVHPQQLYKKHAVPIPIPRKINK